MEKWVPTWVEMKSLTNAYAMQLWGRFFVSLTLLMITREGIRVLLLDAYLRQDFLTQTKHQIVIEMYLWPFKIAFHVTVWHIQGRIHWTWLCCSCRYVGGRLNCLLTFIFLCSQGGFFFFVVLGLTTQLYLGYSSRNPLQYRCSGLTSAHKLPSWSSSDHRVEQSK